MSFQPYLTFDGQAAEAMKTYACIFGGKLDKMLTFGDMPPDAMGGDSAGCEGQPPAGPMPDAVKKRVLHASLHHEGGVLMASDTFPGMPFQGQQGVSVAVSFTSVARAREVYDALLEGGKAEMPFAETFWVEAFGSVRDRFGTSWLINGGKPKM